MYLPREVAGKGIFDYFNNIHGLEERLPRHRVIGFVTSAEPITLYLQLAYLIPDADFDSRVAI